MFKSILSRKTKSFNDYLKINQKNKIDKRTKRTNWCDGYQSCGVGDLR